MKRKAFVFSALGAGVVAAILLVVGGVLRVADVTVNNLEMIVTITAVLLQVVFGMVMIVIAVVALVGALYIFRKSLASPIILSVATVVAGVTLASFNLFSLIATILLLGAAAMAFLASNKIYPLINKKETAI